MSVTTSVVIAALSCLVLMYYIMCYLILSYHIMCNCLHYILFHYMHYKYPIPYYARPVLLSPPLYLHIFLALIHPAHNLRHCATKCMRVEVR